MKIKVDMDGDAIQDAFERWALAHLVGSGWKVESVDVERASTSAGYGSKSDPSVAVVFSNDAPPPPGIPSDEV